MINNSSDLTKYYSLINQYIDEYIDKGIKPSKLNKYLNKEKLQNFLERKGLKDIDKIDQVVKDVLSDRVSMEKDSVMMFESFRIFESNNIQFDSIKECLYKNVGKSTISHEKILADFYDISLSQIDVINSDEHLFEINNFNKNIKCIIYTNDDIQIIGENLKVLINQQLLESDFDLEYIKIPIKEFIDSNKLNDYLNNYLDINIIKNIIQKVLLCEVEETTPEYQHFIGIV